MVFTGSYASRRTAGMVRVRISLSMPKGCTVDESWPAVMPPWRDVLAPYKAGSIGDAEYERRYRAFLDAGEGRVLREYDALVRRHPGRDIALLCWCGQGRFCHRRILAAWLGEHGRGRIDEAAAPPPPPKDPELF